MNELIPLNDNEAALSKDISQTLEELGIAQLTSDNNKKLILVLIPIALLFLFKDRNPFTVSRPRLSSHNFDRKLIFTKPIPAPITSIDPNSIERLTKILEGVKKVTSIQDLSKTIAKSKNSSGRFNKEIINEIVGLLGDNISSENKAQIHNITNMLSMVDKFKDVKKVFDIQRQMKVTDSSGDSSMQIDAMIDAIKPMLPEEQAKNIDQFKQMAQMMKLMSMFDVNKFNSEDSNVTGEPNE